jgi:hypothetical protein
LSRKPRRSGHKTPPRVAAKTAAFDQHAMELSRALQQSAGYVGFSKRSKALRENRRCVLTITSRIAKPA